MNVAEIRLRVKLRRGCSQKLTILLIDFLAFPFICRGHVGSSWSDDTEIKMFDSCSSFCISIL
jgi:hypothetical protein